MGWSKGVHVLEQRQLPKLRQACGRVARVGIVGAVLAIGGIWVEKDTEEVKEKGTGKEGKEAGGVMPREGTSAGGCLWCIAHLP